MYGKTFWDDVIDFDALVRYGTIDAEDLDLFTRTDSVDEAFDFLTGEMSARFLGEPGGGL